MADNLLDNIYKEGEERWFRVFINDQGKTIKALPYGMSDGYEITAIGKSTNTMAEATIVGDIEDEINSLLLINEYATPIQMQESIRGIFRKYKEELKNKLIIKNKQDDNRS